MAYRLALQPQFANVHYMFHVSILRQYEIDPSQVLSYELIAVEKDLTFVEEPLRVIDRKKQVLWNKVIPLVIVQWKHHTPKEETWEREADMRERYLHLFD